MGDEESRKERTSGGVSVQLEEEPEVSAQRITDCCGAAGGQRAFGRTALEDVDSFPGLSLFIP